MTSDRDDTIVARATPFGTGGLAVVRISGRDAVQIADRFFRSGGGRPLSGCDARYLVHGNVVDGDRILDECLAVRFQAPRSFTGDDVVEFHLHGAPIIADCVISLSIAGGARLATPGEFSRRAFLNGRLDLTQVEAIADVIAAESATTVFVAQRQLHGELRRRLQQLRQEVIDLLGLLELELDFVQDGYSFTPKDTVIKLLKDLNTFVQSLLVSFQTGNRLRHGPRLLLLGRPNVGKSSLFNAMLGYGRALVSPTAGTTRDYLEERLAHNGVQFRLVDTAGLRETEDTIEAEGVARAAELIAMADHVLYLIDPTEAVDLEAECAIAEALRGEYPRTSLSVVLTKSDKHSVEHAGTVRCSIHDADSIRTILDGLTASYSQNLAESIALVTDRQFRHLSAMHEILSGIGDDVLEQTELLSAELRALLRPLSELTGEIVTDDVLNALFGSFCIGK